jgi:hypothetical protein
VVALTLSAALRARFEGEPQRKRPDPPKRTAGRDFCRALVAGEGDWTGGGLLDETDRAAGHKRDPDGASASPCTNSTKWLRFGGVWPKRPIEGTLKSQANPPGFPQHRLRGLLQGETRLAPCVAVWLALAGPRQYAPSPSTLARSVDSLLLLPSGTPLPEHEHNAVSSLSVP